MWGILMYQSNNLLNVYPSIPLFLPLLCQIDVEIVKPIMFNVACTEAKESTISKLQSASTTSPESSFFKYPTMLS